jgi:CMP-N,N'-diacetyllegionaminic acid synthase
MEEHMEEDRVLAIIPARKGSVGIGHKNRKEICGKSLVEWAYDTAMASKVITDVIITSDDPEVLKIDPDRSMKRDDLLSRGESGSMVRTVLDALRYEECVMPESLVDIVVLLQPTSPLRRPEWVDSAISMLKDDPEADCVFSAYRVEDHHPARMYTMADNNMGGVAAGNEPPRGIPLAPEYEMDNRAHNKDTYHRNGMVYAARRSLLLRQGLIVGGRRLMYVMPRKYSTNIDDPFDLIMVRHQMEKWIAGEL